MEIKYFQNYFFFIGINGELQARIQEFSSGGGGSNFPKISTSKKKKKKKKEEDRMQGLWSFFPFCRSML